MTYWWKKVNTKEEAINTACWLSRAKLKSPLEPPLISCFFPTAISNVPSPGIQASIAAYLEIAGGFFNATSRRTNDQFSFNLSCKVPPFLALRDFPHTRPKVTRLTYFDSLVPFFPILHPHPPSLSLPHPHPPHLSFTPFLILKMCEKF